MKGALILLWAALIMFTIWVAGVENRVIVLEKACHGQCQFGDHGCKERCDAYGHCPMGDR